MPWWSKANFIDIVYIHVYIVIVADIWSFSMKGLKCNVLLGNVSVIYGGIKNPFLNLLA